MMAFSFEHVSTDFMAFYFFIATGMKRNVLMFCSSY